MVVVLGAALLAYRLSRNNKKNNEEDGEEQQQQEEGFKASAEEYLERAEALGRTSSDFLVRTALSCTRSDTTSTTTRGEEASSTVSSHERPYYSRVPSHHQQQKQQGKKKKISKMSFTSGNNKSHESNGIVCNVADAAAASQGSPITDSVIRQEWIDAVFGPSFFPSKLDSDYSPPRQGTGLSNIAHYVSYEAQIPPCSSSTKHSEDGHKVGVTLSKLALGIYAKHVAAGSEAHAAGIEEGSVLVDINGIGMLAEPSKQALERMWQYEGISNNRDADSEAGFPIVFLKLIKNGSLYNVVLASKPPYGISWASCGNFALVQKSYSHALDAGVRRGSLLASINEKSMRDFDISGAAAQLKELFQSDQPIRMSLVYTPAAARASHYERSLAVSDSSTPRKKQSSSPRKQPMVSQEGVEVRVHPLEYSIGAFLNSSFRNEGPTTSTRQTTYAPCPAVQAIQMFERWPVIDDLGYLVRFCNVSFNQDLFLSQHVLLERKDPAAALVQWLSGTKDAHLLVGPFFLQFLGTLCFSKSINDQDDEHSKGHAVDDAAVRDANLLTQCLLDVARENNRFCQSFYFLLRSYIATLEEQRKTIGMENTSRGLLSVLQTLDVLKSAEKQLVEQLSDGTREETNLLGDELQTKSNVSDDSGMSGRSSPKKLSSGKKKKSRLRSLYRKSSSKHQKDADRDGNEKKRTSPQKILPTRAESAQSVPPAQLLDNMNKFLSELDGICDSVERSLLKSVSKKITEWALQPWSSSKETTLSKVTGIMRDDLKRVSGVSPKTPVANPFNSGEMFVGLDSSDSWILPSAHFPMLLSFVVKQNESNPPGMDAEQEKLPDASLEECLHRTRVEIVAGSMKGEEKDRNHQCERRYFVQGAVRGIMKESGRSAGGDGAGTHLWERDNVLTFDTRSLRGGAPSTLALRVSLVEVDKDGQDQVVKTDADGKLHYSAVVGWCYVDLRPMWRKLEKLKRQKGSGFSTVTCHAQVLPYADNEIAFDQHGELIHEPLPKSSERIELHFRVTTECLEFDHGSSGFLSPKRMLLYKHDDDLRQELFAIEFMKTCDNILKASGLDMKLLTFECMPVGSKRGFIEWLPGSVPLSDICAPRNTSLGSEDDNSRSSDGQQGSANTCLDDEASISEIARAGLMKYQYFRGPQTEQSPRGSFLNNPIQDFLRNAAYDSEAPYMVQKDVMDTYVKSCAGYCVITYLLGVGDRHLDNLLMHQTGHFFHCDFSFILGNDPKKYLPMRITEDMIHGMGGRESDNYAMFLSLAGAAFIALRRHENVRVILSLARLMVSSDLPDLSVNRDPSIVVLSLRDRLRLDLSDHEAITFMEELIESSISSKMWAAVDALHSLGKRF